MTRMGMKVETEARQILQQSSHIKLISSATYRL